MNIIKINKKDNVAVALSFMAKNSVVVVDGMEISLQDDIEQGHKFAICNIKKDETVIKYGYSIGTTKTEIKIGEHIHTHNIKTGLNDALEYTYTQKLTPIKKTEKTFFKGYKRKNGTVGVRNEIWVIPTVGCVNSVCTEIVKRAKPLLLENVEDIVGFTHPYGCSQMGDDQENTKQILANLANHPNAGAVLILGLGCENSSVDEIKKLMGEINDERVKFVVAQDCEDEIEASLYEIKKLNSYANQFVREEISSEKLIIGLKCGGSDGLSGITANPAVGEFSDLLISKGGTTILTEVPEMFGAETILMERCESEEVFQKTVKLINDFKDYFIKHEQVVYENPSPGNKKGGISTLEDKALGCTQKSGSAIVVDVLPYGGIVEKSGLNLLSSPGNDLVAATALAAAGAHIVLFTTGRGTPFACPVPTVKISSNTPLQKKKSNWIDFDCGKMVESDSNVEINIGQELFDYVISVSSGKKVKAEEMGYHDLAIFKQGVTL